MGLSPHALFQALRKDLQPYLPTVRLWETPFRIDYWAGINNTEAACVSLNNSLFKKYVETSDLADAAAIADFVAGNDRCKVGQLNVDRIDELGSIILGEFFSNLHECFLVPGNPEEEILDFESILSNGDFGPGSNVGATGGSFYHKLFDSPLSTTSGSLYAGYLAYISRFESWRNAELQRRASHGQPEIVVGSKLSNVNKTVEISRSICSEPTLNMFYQKGIGHQLENSLIRHFGIYLDIQPKLNAMLAQIGSLTGKIGTIDLKSASNSIAMWLLKHPGAVPPRSLGWLLRSRSPSTVLPSGDVVQLHMVSSMGNAFTFPLMTLIFACVVKAVYHALDIELIRPRISRRSGYDPRVVRKGNFGVFGDDIIVDARAYDRVVNTLERLGFLVNHDKSFNEGHFRESCGADYWHNYNVRGVYCKSLRTKHDRYTLINNLNLWSCNHEIPLTNAIRLLMKTVPLVPVPSWETDTAGVKVPLDYFEELSGSDDKRLDSNGSYIYTRYVAKSLRLDHEDIQVLPGLDPVWQEAILTVNLGRPPQDGLITHLKRLHGNPLGILVAAVEGKLLDGSVSLRSDSVLYYKGLSVAPCWDYVNLAESRFTARGWHNWITGWALTNLPEAA